MITNEQRYSDIQHQWRKFINDDIIDNPDIIPDDILSSWVRSKQKKVNPYLKKIPVVLTEGQLQWRLCRNEEWINISIPYINKLYSLVRGSGFVVALCDHEGYLLKIIGDSDVTDRIRKGNFIPGACWHEDVSGTNGVGTVLEIKKPIQVFASEHYSLVSHHWTCSGAPIRDPDGVMIGVVDMTGPYNKTNPHTLGMVAATAHAIENALVAERALSLSQVSYYFQKTVIESVPEALIAFNKENRVELINDKAKRMLHLWPDIVGKHANDIFGGANGNFLHVLVHNEMISDAELKIFVEDKSLSFTVSANPILSASREVLGKIVTLNEINRARKLVASMTGARAKFRFNDIITCNARVCESITMARHAARSISNVLLLGESGTGKDILAQAIHNESMREHGPFIAINCAAIPRELLVSELIGYGDGAFTGSKRGGNAGKFELSHGGTIFLDEIGEIPLELQAILLRVIEEKAITRIGSKELRPIDVRIIAATNKNLKEEVEKKNFREDLYYRLNVLSIELIPLRERIDDIPHLVNHFIRKIGNIMHKEIQQVEDRVLEAFMHHSWPGNVRELQNIIERMINMAETDTLTIDHVPAEMRNPDPDKWHYGKEDMSLDEMERRIILNMMKSKLSKEAVATKLHIGRSTLYRKLRKYGIQ